MAMASSDLIFYINEAPRKRHETPYGTLQSDDCGGVIYTVLAPCYNIYITLCNNRHALTGPTFA
jgi:hypothetical protein